VCETVVYKETVVHKTAAPVVQGRPSPHAVPYTAPSDKRFHRS
jgi:hypothetical protein